MKIEETIDKYLSEAPNKLFSVTISYPGMSGMKKEEEYKVSASNFGQAENKALKYAIKEFGKDSFRIEGIKFSW